ncbi:MAG: hypothetical protein DSY76_05970 [Bacteroidetes bacterium]|nr:MAG: hypothetical protein DSY76_05970 [Bacteroidota bacterium]
MAKEKRHIGFLGYFLRFINILLIIALLISYLAQWISPRHFWPIAFFGMAYPALAIANFFFIIHWLIRRRKFVIYPLVSLLIGIGMISRFISMGSNVELANANTFKILTYNVHVFGRFIKNHQGETNYERDEIIKFLKKQQPDILCMQEFRSVNKGKKENNIKLIKKECGYKYYYAQKYSPKSKKFFQIIFSKYPIKNSGYIPSVAGDNEITAIYADIEIEGKIVRVYNTHLQSYKISSDTYLIKNSLNNLDVSKSENQEKLARTSKHFAKKFKKAFEKRALQISALQDHMEHSPYPIILAGDFNDTPSSYAYGQLSSDLDDAFVETGSGFGQTYIGPYPSFRIDYILHSPELNNQKFDTWKIKFSDHYPISAVFSWDN